MGNVPYYTDSEETEATSASSVEGGKKKKKLSILKRTNGNIKKKKCKLHIKSDPEDLDFERSKSSFKSKHKIRGILKCDHERESSEEDKDNETHGIFDRCLVGTVPRTLGTKPGKGGGVSIIIQRNANGCYPSLEPHATTSSRKKKTSRRFLRKRSF